MTERYGDTFQTTPLLAIDGVPDCEMPGNTTVVDEQYFIDAARAGIPVRDIDLARWYIKHYKILRVAHFEETNGIKRLTICHTWRIERYPDHRIRLYRFDIQKKIWHERDTLLNWPTIPLHSAGLNWVYDLVDTACGWALVAARFTLPNLCHGEKMPDRYTFRDFSDICIPGTYESGARALRSLLWQHFINREILSAVVVMYGVPGDLVRYLHHAQYRDSLLKVAKERRNLLPLLRLIYPQSWGRDNLFAKQLWYRNGRAYTALDRYPYKLGKRESGAIRINGVGQMVRHHLSFADARCWNWLRRASPSVVRAWVDNGAHPEIITLLADADNHQRIPARAWLQLLDSSRNFDCKPEHAVQMTRLVRLYLTECARIWRDDGFEAVKRWIVHSRYIIHALLDWLYYGGGLAQGQPARNATWQSLLRRCDDWHRYIAHEQLQARIAAGEKIRWESALPETVIDGIVFTPLNDGKALTLEGHEMDHCIASYMDSCRSENYRVYAVREPDGTRSTLGISIEEVIEDPGMRITLNQHYGLHNQPVSEAAARAGEKLVALYAQALLTQ